MVQDRNASREVVFSSAPAAATNYHSLAALTAIYLLTVLEDGNLRSGCPRGQSRVRILFLDCRQPATFSSGFSLCDEKRESETERGKALWCLFSGGH